MYMCMHVRGYHIAGHGEDWARGNRLMCDLLHRGITSPAPHMVDRFARPREHSSRC